ncbi:DUF1697 domain-containing protein [Arthrobacter sp. ISL-5]|uniref:DUF1697 domain-containing protein n=1 Tax=Arthrobacter sp. ISL-5 TaxID=2819111 RepID=UPI001BE5BCEC|nr:DUF1697 domain-containing protein [Arthrobacter sp. ISL-5]MBT2553950.1 DUF1697 domain-containing protein [Arthrobacter sp. ISL-5]
MPSSVALLRGINVGGKNLIRMPDLSACFRDAGHRDVRTYIQSGNVLFTPDHAAGPELEDALERGAEATTLRASLMIRIARPILPECFPFLPKNFTGAMENQGKS